MVRTQRIGVRQGGDRSGLRGHLLPADLLGSRRTMEGQPGRQGQDRLPETVPRPAQLLPGVDRHGQLYALRSLPEEPHLRPVGQRLLLGQWRIRLGLRRQFRQRPSFGGRQCCSRRHEGLFQNSNAVDKNGQPANLKYIDFIRVQTGVNAKAGWLGENSTEVFGFTDENINQGK